MVSTTLRVALLSLGLWLGALGPAFAQGQAGPANQILCNNFAQASIATATTTSLVNGVAGKIIVICGWHVTSTQNGGTNTFQLEYGTQGGPCTTPTTITPAFQISNTAPSSDHVDFASLSIPIGAQLCIVTTGTTVGTAAGVWFAQY